MSHGHVYVMMPEGHLVMSHGHTHVLMPVEALVLTGHCSLERGLHRGHLREVSLAAAAVPMSLCQWARSGLVVCAAALS
jgi:hypothetical protein